MSTPVALPRPALAGPGAVGAWLDDLEVLLDRARALDATAETGAQILTGVQRLVAATARLAALRLRLLAAADARHAPRAATGATSTIAWLRSEGMSAGAAAREVALAQALDEHPATSQALAEGRISVEAAHVVTTALDGLSEAVPTPQKTAAEAGLLAQAARMDPGQLRKHAAARAACLDPTGAGDLAAHEHTQATRRELSIVPGPDGMHHLHGRLDPLAAATLHAALDPLARPRPSTAEGPDPRNPARRRADALLDLAHRALTTGELPDAGGTRPTLVVTVDLEVLRGQLLGTAHLHGGPLCEPLSAATARRLACDAQLIPAVLGTAGEVLDLGRATRTATPAQRRALALRDHGCAFPGCDRPPGWTDAHHIRHWADGGGTDIDNLVLLCGAHHDTIHHHGWTIRMISRRPRFHPPTPPPPEPPPGWLPGRPPP